ncbi:MAG: metallophosphoesterase, partial [Pyrinomonadaceae bacterium]
MKTFVVGDVHGRCAQLRNLLEMIPRDEGSDTLVFLGDLIDRGLDAPGCVTFVFKLCHDNPERVICLRGNHEQMLLEFVEGKSNIWITPVTGGERTFEQYTGRALAIDHEEDIAAARRAIETSVP